MTARLRFDLHLRRRHLHLRAAATQAGPVLGVRGPSGAGKTTLLRALAGLEGHVGTLWVDGEDWSRRAPWQRPVGWVPQEATLFPLVSVRENLCWADTNADPDPVARALHLTGLLDRRPAALSGGERQRVALGRALLRRPPLLLLDEPFSALDDERAADAATFVNTWRAEHDALIVVVAHDHRTLQALGATPFTLSDGELTPS